MGREGGARFSVLSSLSIGLHERLSIYASGEQVVHRCIKVSSTYFLPCASVSVYEMAMGSLMKFDLHSSPSGVASIPFLETSFWCPTLERVGVILL